MSDLEQRLSSGDWITDAWFLRGVDDFFEKADFSLDRRKKAGAALARLYPPELCQRMRAQEDMGLVYPLFSAPWPLMISHLLEVGLDLADPGCWEDEALIGRLRQVSEFSEAAFELRVRASLGRNGYLVRKIPERGTSTADFLVQRGALACELEVKFPNSSALDRFVRTKASPALMHAMQEVNGFALKLFGDEQLEDRALDPEGLKAIEHDLPNMVSAFAKVSAEIAAAPHVGRFDVPGYGYIEVEPVTQGLAEVSPLVFPEQDEAKRARRVFSLISKSLAKRQFSGKVPGVYVVGVFRRAKLPLVENAMWEWAGKPNRSLRPTHMVVLVDNIKTDEFRFTQIAYPICARHHRQLTKAQLRLAKAAGGDCHGVAKLARRTRTGERGLELDTSRREETLVKVAEVKMPAERSRITLRFDGSEPEIVPSRDDEDGE